MPRWKVLCNVDFSRKPDALNGLKAVADVDCIEADRGALLERIGDYDVYIASLFIKMDAEVFKAAGRLKLIATPSTGTDHIDKEIAAARGIEVVDIAREYELLDTFSATAELAWGLLLACIRRLPAAFEEAKKGNWLREGFTGRQLMGKTLGIVGYGRLGRMIGEFGKAFRMKVIACDKRKFQAPGIEPVDFDRLLSVSDVISIHIHSTKENRGLFSNSAFERMKQGVIILNTSRGAIIDEAAFLKALESGKVDAAGLDVVCGEWSKDLAAHPLIQYARSHDNLIIVPHIGGCTEESIIGARVFLVEKLIRQIKEKSQ